MLGSSPVQTTSDTGRPPSGSADVVAVVAFGTAVVFRFVLRTIITQK